MAKDLTDAAIQETWEKYGGIARFAFNENPQSLIARLNTALTECSLSSILEGAGLSGRLDRLHGYSSMLLHYNVSYSAVAVAGAARQAVIQSQLNASAMDASTVDIAAFLPLPFQLENPPLRVSTQWMKRRIFEEYEKFKLGEIVKFLDDCMGKSKLAGVRGDMFEPYAHTIMSRNGTQSFWIQQLNPAGGRIGLMSQLLFSVSGARLKLGGGGGMTIANLAVNQYGDHVHTNEATHDAVRDPDTTIQFTTSATHSVVSGGLYDAEAALKAKFHWLHRLDFVSNITSLYHVISSIYSVSLRVTSLLQQASHSH